MRGHQRRGSRCDADGGFIWKGEQCDQLARMKAQLQVEPQVEERAFEVGT